MSSDAGLRRRAGIGLDVGGSGVRAAVAWWTDDGSPLELGPGRSLAADAGAPLARVLADGVRALLGSARQRAAPGTAVLVAVGAPGWKSADLRGIAMARHLPACPHLLDELEAELDSAVPSGVGVQLASRLHSDAEAALAGELRVAGGLAPDARDAVFLGPGTGLAEAWVVDGAFSPVAGPRAALVPPLVDDGTAADLEEEASLAALTRRFGGDGRVEDAAGAGDERARDCLARFGQALARVLDLRLEVLRRVVPGRALRVVVRTRGGSFFPHPAVRDIVVPVLANRTARHGAELLVPMHPAASTRACAGALALAVDAPRCGDSSRPTRE